MVVDSELCVCVVVVVVVVVIEYSSNDLVGLVINEISRHLILVFLCTPDRSDLGLGQYLGSTLHRITR